MKYGALVLTVGMNLICVMKALIALIACIVISNINKAIKYEKT
jgi:hypothetical protein